VQVPASAVGEEAPRPAQAQPAGLSASQRDDLAEAKFELRYHQGELDRLNQGLQTDKGRLPSDSRDLAEERQKVGALQGFIARLEALAKTPAQVNPGRPTGAEVNPRTGATEVNPTTADAERQRLTKSFEGFGEAIDAITRRINKQIGNDLITTPPPAGTPGGQTPPPQIQAPPVNLQFGDQFREMLAVVTDSVRDPLQAQISQMQSDFRSFLSGNRFDSAQAAASSAI
jgi:hypothetical protein